MNTYVVLVGQHQLTVAIPYAWEVEQGQQLAREVKQGQELGPPERFPAVHSPLILGEGAAVSHQHLCPVQVEQKQLVWEGVAEV